LTALDFCSLYQDKELKKKSQIDDENSYKDLAPDIPGF
jgi:hypothetical protein